MSVAVARPPSALFREEQNFPWWLYALVALLMIGATTIFLGENPRFPAAPIPFRWPRLEAPIYLTIGLGLPMLLVLGVLHMTTEITTNVCRITFGWLPTYCRLIALSEVAHVEVVTYHAVREHGFWGIRVTREGERVFTARGDKAVRLTMRDGARILIGTQRPDELAGLIERERIA